MRSDVVLRKVKENKGFTLLETLIVVAIMTVLTAVSFLAVGDMKESVGMTELDEYAKSIYLEAQNRLSAIEVEGGMPKLLKELEDNYEECFLTDAAPKDYLEEDEKWKEICYLTRDEAVSVGLMSQGAYSSQMTGNYVLEINATSGDVYGAFYWEAEDDISYESVIETLATRNRTDRVEDELGYYGGTVMNTLALLENAPFGPSVHMGGFGGDRGGFVYYEQYENGEYGVFVVGDNKDKAYDKGYDYDAAMTSFPMGENSLRNEKCVRYGFAAFGGLKGIWRWVTPETSGRIQDCITLEEKGEVMPNIMTDPELQNSYTLYKIVEFEGALGVPKEGGNSSYVGSYAKYEPDANGNRVPIYDNRYYLEGWVAYQVPGENWHQQLFQVSQFLNRFLVERYDELNGL